LGHYPFDGGIASLLDILGNTVRLARDLLRVGAQKVVDRLELRLEILGQLGNLAGFFFVQPVQGTLTGVLIHRGHDVLRIV